MSVSKLKGLALVKRWLTLSNRVVSTHWIKHWCSLMHTLYTLDPLDWRREKRVGTGSKGNSRLGPSSLSFLRRFSRTFLHWILNMFLLKAGNIFLASGARTTLCKIGHRSESMLTCFEHFLSFIQIVWNWGRTSWAEQRNGARGQLTWKMREQKYDRLTEWIQVWIT